MMRPSWEMKRGRLLLAWMILSRGALRRHSRDEWEGADDAQPTEETMKSYCACAVALSTGSEERFSCAVGAVVSVVDEEVVVNADGTCGLSPKRDTARVASEGFDVVVDPF